MFNHTLIKNRVLNVLNKAVNSDFGSTITYKKFVSENFDPSIGSKAITYNEYEIKVLPESSLEMLGSSTVLKAIGYGAGEKLYYLSITELPRNPNDKDIFKDIIVDNGNDYKIKKVIPVFDILVVIQV